MSGLFGCLYLDGRPMASGLLETMRRAMVSWGPGGLFGACSNSAAMGFANLPLLPEALGVAMPCCDELSDTLFTASARLDNREELCERFGLSPAGRLQVADERLVMLAWEAWGEGAPEHLDGDWAFAAWDGQRRRLFLARDPLGNTGLYYLSQPPFFAFCSAFAFSRAFRPGSVCSQASTRPRL